MNNEDVKPKRRNSGSLARDQVVRRFCKLATKVGCEVFHSEWASDCFCGANGLVGYPPFRFDSQVMRFIEAAVREKIEREKKAA